MPKDKKSFASDVVKKSQNKNKEMGGGRLTLNLTPEDMEMWQAWLSGFGDKRGAQMTAFRAMLESAVKQGDISKQQVLEWIEKNAK
jgi:hypothetical protein